MRIEDQPACIGAVAEDVDLNRLDDAGFAALEAAFDARSVLCVRDQALSPDALVAFARRFGAVSRIFLKHYAHPENPDIMLVSNIVEDGRNIGHSDAGRVWHSDMSYTAAPPRATVLYAIETPQEDGRSLGATDFASAVHAASGLDAEMRAIAEDRIVRHRVAGRRRKTGTGGGDDPLREAQPDVFHPALRRNPHTGAEAIYVNEGECDAMSGLDDAEAAALVEKLAKEVQRQDYRYRHEWRAGDVLIWDNGAVQHRANFDYAWPRHRRLMWRVTVGAGEG